MEKFLLDEKMTLIYFSFEFTTIFFFDLFYFNTSFNDFRGHPSCREVMVVSL